MVMIRYRKLTSGVKYFGRGDWLYVCKYPMVRVWYWCMYIHVSRKAVRVLEG